MKKMKKLLSIIMVIAMLMAFAVPAATAAEAIPVASGENVTASVETPIYIPYTPESDGVLSVVISGNPGYMISCIRSDDSTVGLPTSKNNGAEQTLNYDLTAGETYKVKIVGYADWAEGTASVTYNVSFTPAEGGSQTPVVKEEWEVSNTKLALGENKVTMLETAVTSLFEFEPTETGTYTITAPSNIKIADWNTTTFPNKMTADADMTNTLEWTCTAVGQGKLIGISDVEGDVTLTITKNSDYQEVEIPLLTYENKATLSPFTLPSDATLGDYVDVYGTTHSAVLGSDGYYHLDSATGPVLLMDMNYNDIVLTDALKSERPIMYAYTTDANGKQVKYDIGAAVQAYEAVMDANGYYPVTEDLIFFYDVYAKGVGTYAFYLTGDYNEECVWMYCCRTVTFTTEPGGSTTPAEPVEGSMEKPIALTVPSTVDMTFTDDTLEKWYVYTAGAADETVIVTIGAPSDATLPMYVDGYYDEPSATGYGDVYNMGDTMEIPLTAGQTIYLKVSTFAATDVSIDFALPAEPVEGDSKDNPIFILDDNSDDLDYTITYTTPEQAAEKTVYYAANRVQGMDLTITGEGNFVAYYGSTPYMAVNGVITIPNFSAENMYTPAVVSIMGENAGSYKMVISSPMGDLMNPAELNTTDTNGNTATIVAGDDDGYYYIWTAPNAGELVLTPADSNTAGWKLQVDNLNTYAQSTIDSTGEAKELVVSVNEGDVIRIMANTYDPENPYTAPAGDVVFDAKATHEHVAEEYACYVWNEDYTEMTMVWHCSICGCDSGVIVESIGPGEAAENPYYISDQKEATTAVIEYAAKAPVGSTYYAVRGASGTTLTFTAPAGVTVTIDGVAVTSPVVVPAAASPYDPTIIVITNAGTADTNMDLAFTYPAGTAENPAVLDDGEIELNLAEGQGGYYCTYVADCTGTLTITVTGDSWSYYLYNLNTYEMTDTFNSADTPDSNSATMQVNAGDVVQVYVSTYNPDDPWGWFAPSLAGKITVAAAGEYAHDWNDGEVTKKATCTVDGEKTYTCGICNDTKTETIKAAGHVDADKNNTCDVCGNNPSTGDTQIVLWTVIATFSALALAAVVTLKKKFAI